MKIRLSMRLKKGLLITAMMLGALTLVSLFFYLLPTIITGGAAFLAVLASPGIIISLILSGLFLVFGGSLLCKLRASGANRVHAAPDVELINARDPDSNRVSSNGTISSDHDRASLHEANPPNRAEAMPREEKVENLWSDALALERFSRPLNRIVVQAAGTNIASCHTFRRENPRSILVNSAEHKEASTKAPKKQLRFVVPETETCRKEMACP